MFTKKELLEILDTSESSTIKNKIIKKLKLSKIDYEYTYFIGPKGTCSKHYATPEKAQAVVEKIIGKWSKDTAKRWGKYEFVDVSFGSETSYTY